MTETDLAGEGPIGDGWSEKWSEMVQNARSRPQMYVGDPAFAHRHVMGDLFRLVWQAGVFRRPQRVRVDLSPHQCVVRCDTGPLIRPVQAMFSFPGGRVMGDTWGKESRVYFSRLSAEDEARGLPWGRHRSRCGWRYCFSGPIGPRLTAVKWNVPLARRLTWGLRTDQGLWCQAYESGWPAGTPFLVDDPSPVGLFVLADLDPVYFTGLPYDAEDVGQLRAASFRKVDGGQRWRPRPAWSGGEIVVDWHEQDNLVTKRALTAEGVREWL